MRKVFDLILLFLLLAFLFWQKEPLTANFNYLRLGPCDRPITYRLGLVDADYGFTPQQFLVKVEEADQIWSRLVSKNLFVEKPDGKLIINLIYSDRQSMFDNLNQLESGLQTGKQSLDTSIADFKNLQADFEKKLSEFNAEVEKWNRQGGAPEDVFNQLKNPLLNRKRVGFFQLKERLSLDYHRPPSESCESDRAVVRPLCQPPRPHLRSCRRWPTHAESPKTS